MKRKQILIILDLAIHPSTSFIKKENSIQKIDYINKGLSRLILIMITIISIYLISQYDFESMEYMFTKYQNQELRILEPLETQEIQQNQNGNEINTLKAKVYTKEMIDEIIKMENFQNVNSKALIMLKQYFSDIIKYENIEELLSRLINDKNLYLFFGSINKITILILDIENNEIYEFTKYIKNDNDKYSIP